MKAVAQTSVCEVTNGAAQNLVYEVPVQSSLAEASATTPRFDPIERIRQGLKRRLARERRRRKVGRAYDMALEIARLIPKDAEVLDVGCGNGFIAHHLSSLLGTKVLGIDVMNATEAPIPYQRYDGAHFPVARDSSDAVLFCYVLHHARDAANLMQEVRRVLRAGGVAIIYEDIPRTGWDKAICWIHNRQWKHRSGPCTFRNEVEWQRLFRTAGFEVIHERPLSRSRNFTHPVCRRLFVLKLMA